MKKGYIAIKIMKEPKVSSCCKAEIKHDLRAYLVRNLEPLEVSPHIAKVLRKNGIREEHGYRVRKL